MSEETGDMISIGRKLWSLAMQLCRGFLSMLCKVFRVELADEKWDAIEQFIKFACVGCSNAVVLLVVYYVVVLTCGESAYLLGQTLGYVIGIVNSYLLNSKFVFSATGSRPRGVFLKMCLCYAVTYIVQAGILYVGVEMLYISEMIVPIIAIFITTPMNFFLNKWFVFQGKVRRGPAANR